MQLSKGVARIKLQVERMRARHGAFDVLMQTLKTFSMVDGGTHAAALTYYFFFSIFPLLLASASILGYLTFGNETLRQDLLDAGVESVPLIRGLLTDDTLTQLEEQRGRIALTAIVLAFYSGTGAIVALGHALNRIYGVVQERNFIGKRLASIKWLLVLGGATLLSLALGTMAGYAAAIFDGTAATFVSTVLGTAAGFAVGVLVFSTAFRFLPNKRMGWREVLPGALVAAGVFEILKKVGAWYLERGAEGRQATFGALAAAAGFLVASYLLAQVILMAATLNDVLAERHATRQSQGNIDKEGQDGIQG